MANKLIGLLTDFGSDNHYVSQMKGRILGICSDVKIVDITHSVSPQNVNEGAFILADCVDAFPQQTIFVAVVDPGVGTSRDILILSVDQRLYVLPDNGLATELIRRDGIEAAYRIRDSFFEDASNTFHGRDVMAPVAAHLAAGRAVLDLSDKIDPSEVLQLELPRPVAKDSAVQGQIVFVDCFGNLISNIDESMIQEQQQSCLVEVGDHQITGVRKTFADVSNGDLICLVGSHDRLEIAMNCGNAAKSLGISLGAPVRISW